MPKVNRLIVFVCLLLIAISSNGQKFEWVNFFQGQNTQSPVSISVDTSGNQYATFYFINEIKHDSINLVNYSNDQRALVVKQNPEGKALWYKVIEGTTTFQSVYPLASRFNSKGNLLVFVTSTENIRVGNDTIKRKGTAGTSYAYYLLEFNDTGKVINSNHLIDGALINISYGGNEITNDKNDNLYINLAFTGLVYVYDSTGTVNIGTSTSGSRNIIFKFSNSGRVLKWTSTLDYSPIEVNSIKVDIHENVYAATYWRAYTNITFLGKSWSNPQNTTGTVFIWDKNGNEKNFFYVEASGKNSTIYDIAVYDSNSIYISGAYQGDSARFDTIWKKNNLTGGYLFFARYDINGKIKWVKVEDTTYTTVIFNYNYYTGMTNYKDIYFYLSYYIPYHNADPIIFDGQKYEAKPNGYGVNFKVDERGNILWGYRTLYPFSSMGTDLKDNFYFQGRWEGDTINLGSFKAFPNGTDAFLGKTTDYSINRGNVFAGPYCAGDTILVPFTKIGEFDTSNYFIAELSDEFGVFDGNERELGRIKATNDSLVVGKLPLFKTASSGNYRIRIISTNPIVQSYYKFDKLRLLIYSRDKADPGPTDTICYGDTLKLNTYGGTKWTWSPKYNMNDSNLRQPLAWPLKDTTYQIIIADSSGCGEPDTALKQIVIRKPLALSLAFSDTIVCDTSLLKLPMNFTGGDAKNHQWKAFTIEASGLWDTLATGKSQWFDTLMIFPKASFGVPQKLAIVLDDDCTNKKDTAYLSIQLLAPSKISNKFKDTLVCVGNSIIRKANAVYPLKNYQWQWLDKTNNVVISNSDSLNIVANTSFTVQLTLNNGCTADTNQFTVSVNPPLKAELLSNLNKLNDTSICYGQLLKLNSIALGGLKSKYQREWQLDGKVVSTTDSFLLQSTAHFADSGGTKKIRLILKDNCTVKSDTISKNITVLSAPVADFGHGIACNRSNTEFNFTGLKWGDSTSFLWTFEGEGTSNVENPTKRLSIAGNRKVNLKLNNNNGCKSEVTKQVEVKVQSKADFEFKDSCDKDSVSFINQSEDATDYIWYFGDGEGSNLPSVKHLYPNAFDSETYAVQLVAVFKDGCSDSITKTIKILASPKADFDFDGICSEGITNFTFNGNLPQSPNTTTFDWNFNNEGSSTLTNPTFPFSSTGAKTTTLLLTSSNGCSDSITKIVEIKTQSEANFTANDVCETDSVLFNNLSRDATSYNWKFGDGNFSKTASPKYLYRLSGGKTLTFNVTLVAIGSHGCSDSITKAVNINANPISDFSYTKTGNKLELKAIQTNNTVYFWKFDDKDSVSTNTTDYTHTLTNPDQKSVCLKVINVAGCSSETCKAITLSALDLEDQNSFKLYPNPNSGEFNIALAKKHGNLSIAIVNAIGQVVYKTELEEELVNEISLQLAKGVYTVRVKNGEYTLNQRMLVDK